MTLDIALVLAILAGALALFVTERIRMDVVALMVLSALALTGLVSPAEAVSGFSNPAVVTVWAMFILSEGLMRAGIGDIIGRNLLRSAGQSEARLIGVIMLVAGVLSGIMNNTGIAALMLPVVVDVARRSGVAPSKLLMPMAYGTLLGGLTTLIGTAPNLLASDALRDAGLRPFRLFDFTPLGVLILLAGTAFMVFVGRHLLPANDPLARPRSHTELQRQYGLQERIFAIRVPRNSVLVGKSIAEARLSAVAGLIIIARTRAGRTAALPAYDTVLQGGDVLLAQGRIDRFDALRRWSGLSIEREAPVLQSLLSDHLPLRQARIAPTSRLAGAPLRHAGFRDTFHANILALRRGDEVHRARLDETPLAAGDRLLVQCTRDSLARLETSPEFDEVAEVPAAELARTYGLDKRLFVVRVPKDSPLSGITLRDSGLDDAFDFRLLAVFRAGGLTTMPEPDETIRGGDLLLVQGDTADLDVLRGLQQLDILRDASPYLGIFEPGQLDMIEATLHPRSSLAGRAVADLDLRERRQVELVAIWRGGKPHRSEVKEMTLQSGDALLFVGPRHRLADLSRDPDLIVITPLGAPPADTGKTPVAAAIMLAALGAVLAGWLPISVAAVAGATAMVLTRCLSMEEAYRAIDWRAIFLIAGMLPLGLAMQQTGAAALLANAALATLGQYGVWPVIAGLYGVTALATMIIPTPALVVLMAPIALSASAALGAAPHTAMMAVAIAASASFTSPIAHPANVMVMGPGGYRFVDYLKVGVPLALVVFAVAAVFLPLFWPPG